MVDFEQVASVNPADDCARLLGCSRIQHSSAFVYDAVFPSCASPRPALHSAAEHFVSVLLLWAGH
jgi:hypothetical protein